jgi:hypothetical protein
LDLQAQKAGVIRVSVIEAGSDKPVAGVRVWGFDAETGSSGRFSAYTDARGRATFHAAPSKINLSIAGPPEGVYIKDDLRWNPDIVANFEFKGGEIEVTLKLPAIAGSLIGIAGTCTLPGGKPAQDVTVYAAAGRFETSDSSGYIRERRTDDTGRFRLEGVPGGERIYVYAESADRKVAGVYDFKSHPKPDPRFRINVGLAPTVDVERTFKDRGGHPLASKKFHVVPKIGEEEFIRSARTVESDAEGRVRFHGVVPGLSYHIQAGEYDEVLALAPEAKK